MACRQSLTPSFLQEKRRRNTLLQEEITPTPFLLNHYPAPHALRLTRHAYPPFFVHRGLLLFVVPLAYSASQARPALLHARYHAREKRGQSHVFRLSYLH